MSSRRGGRSALTYLAVFGSCGVVFGLVRTVATGSLQRGLIAGVVFGAIMAVTLGTLERVGQRGNTGSWSPRRDTTIDVPADLTVARRQTHVALGQLRAWVVRDEPRRITARTGISWKTWGLVLDVGFDEQPGPDPTRVRVRVRPRLPTTLIDYGAAHRAVAAFEYYLTPTDDRR